ncbi:MAG: tetratricopeptide repeat protein [Chloroflexi bacterium]|nr:MAG: tetratricopeptide repeat protein [Chloroflexota bacterium]
MTDEQTAIDSNPINQPNVDDLAQDAPDTPQGLRWHFVIIGLVALVVIAVLAFPFFTGQSQPAPQTAPAANEPAELSAPQATAQANPNSAQAQFELGNSYYESGRFDDAVTAYQAAIELDPNYQAAYANLGVVYYQLQKFDLAATQYKKALEINPEDGDVAYNLGALYLQQALANSASPDTQLLQKSIAQLEKAREISPDLAEPYFSLGVAHMALNQRQEAIQAFDAYLTFDASTDSRARQEAERYLNILNGQ